MGHYESFIVRMWIDEDAEKIRGQIQHVKSQEVCRFRSLDKMVCFIMAHLTPPGDLADGGNAVGNMRASNLNRVQEEEVFMGRHPVQETTASERGEFVAGHP